MITRQAAEDQAQTCFLYNAGGFLVAAFGASLFGSPTLKTLTGLWGLGVAAHAVMLYGIPEAREKLLMWTAAGMEERQQFFETERRGVMTRA